MARHIWSAQPLAGNCAVNGRMAQHPGRNLLTSRNHILLRPQNMSNSLALTMNQFSTGGFLTFWGRETPFLSLVRKQNPCYLKRTHKFGIEVPKTVKEALELDRKNENTFWAYPIARRWRTFASPSKSYLMGSLHQLTTRKYPATWFLTSTWKFFNAKPD